MSRFVLFLLLAVTPFARAATDAPFAGTVVDQHGKPIEGAVLCGQWGPESYGKVPRCLLPAPATTDSSGHFSITLPPPRLWFGDNMTLLVYDRSHTTGALVDIPKPDLAQPARIELRPLQSVHYRILSPVPIKRTDLSGRITASGAPLVALWGDEGTVLLPTGTYRIGASVFDSEHAQSSFEVGKTPVQLKPLKLVFSKMAQRYGRTAPRVGSLVDMGDKPFNIGSTKGHWTLVYFWEDGCIPCIQTGMPALIALAKKHQDKAANLSIVAVHTRMIDEPLEWEEVHKNVLKLESTLWHDVPEFPMLYDESGKTTQAWGIRMWPTYGLIDPHGNLVRVENLSEVETKVRIPPDSAKQ
jgi:thiol-disulfide isomerase/thioredoxin